MKRVCILTVLILMGQNSWAQIRKFETTRLKSTAGAGVASVLSSEAAILNPAASTFFSGSSFAYHHNKTTLRKESEERKLAQDKFSTKNKSQGFFLSENEGPLKGGVAYITQNENDYEREQFIAHASAPVGASTSMGFSYSYVQDLRPSELFKKKRKNSHVLNVGLLSVVEEDVILGLVLSNPTRSLTNEERLVAGFQYTILDKITLIADLGTQYTQDVVDKHLWRAAIQLNIFSDFFLRMGRFYDNIEKEKGMGWGASWMGPRLGVEFAQKFSEQLDQHYTYKGEEIIDTSLSVFIKF